MIWIHPDTVHGVYRILISTSLAQYRISSWKYFGRPTFLADPLTTEKEEMTGPYGISREGGGGGANQLYNTDYYMYSER